MNTSRVEGNLERFRPVLVSLAEALISPSLRGHIEASDLVQQTMLEAHQNVQLLSTLPDAPFFQWLRTALKHNLLDAVKSAQSLKHDVGRKLRACELEESFLKLDALLVADQTTPSQVAQRNEQMSELLAALQQLSENQRKAIICRHLQGLSLKATADMLGFTESRTAGLLHRGRKSLVKLLGVS